MINYLYKTFLIPKKVKQFFTPKKYVQSKREMSFEKSTKSELVYIPSIDKEICIYAYGYSTKKVLLVHGWSGRGTQFYRIADKLLENRMMVVFFDAPGHGLSSGKTTHLLEFVEIIKHLQKENFYGAIGHSIGATALLHFQGVHAYFKKMVLIGTLSNSDKVINKLVKPKFKTNFKEFALQKYKIDLDRYNGIDSAKAIKTPTLIIHDSKDKMVAVSNAFGLRQNIPNAELLITQKLGHTKILQSVKISNKIIQFLQ